MVKNFRIFVTKRIRTKTSNLIMAKFYKRDGDDIYEYDSYSEYVKEKAISYVMCGLLILALFAWASSL